MKQCKRCHSNFRGRSFTQIFCSKTCRNKFDKVKKMLSRLNQQELFSVIETALEMYDV